MTDDDKTPATPEEVKAVLEQIYEAGRLAGKQEGQPELREFSNGQYMRPTIDPTFEEYNAELTAKAAELRERGEFRQNHPEFDEIRNRHGR